MAMAVFVNKVLAVLTAFWYCDKQFLKIPKET